jgi:hypothetical protein
MEILKALEKGIIGIETAYKNGLRLVAAGSEIDIKPMSKDYDREQAKLIVQMLQQSSESVKAITADPRAVRETLCKAQETLLRDNDGFLVNLDLWDRLEKAYRMVFPDELSCIAGDDGCLVGAVVRCKACEGVNGGV